MYGHRPSKDETTLIDVLRRRGVYPLYLEFDDASERFTLTAGEGHVLHQAASMNGAEFVVILEQLGIVVNVLYGPNGPAKPTATEPITTGRTGKLH